LTLSGVHRGLSAQVRFRQWSLLNTGGDQHRSRIGKGLHARGDIGRIAKHLARRVDHDWPGVDADAGDKLRAARAGVLAVEFGERALDGERRPHRALGIVLVRPRIAEERHQPVAELLQHMPAKFGHRSRGRVEIGIDEVSPILRVEVRGEAGRADEVAEHHGDRAALG
jgi:hypothetical protein